MCKALLQNDGKVRTCLDQWPLNKAIRRKYYHLPGFNKIASKTKGGKYFIALDARSGYWRIPLDDVSSELTAFNTLFGKYKFLCMPFGLSTSQNIFKRETEKLLKGIPKHSVNIHDVLFWADSEEQALNYLCLTLERCREKRI